LRTSKPR